MRRYWTESEIEALKMLYPDVRAEEIADALDMTVKSIYSAAVTLDLHKSEQFMKTEMSGRITKLRILGERYRFKKGLVPHNKGKKWHEFMSNEGQKNSLETTFHKGHLPHNTKSDNEISVRINDKYAYKYIRESVGKWKPLHVHNWEKTYGKVPEGFIVVFKTTDKTNCDVSNLELITRAENIRRNSIHRYSPELRSTMKTLAKLKRTINGKEQNSGSEKSSLRDDRVA